MGAFGIAFDRHDLGIRRRRIGARFMIVAMMITPLGMIFPTHRWPLWLMHLRRYLGVAAFGYAMLHTAFYIIDLGTLSEVLIDAAKLSIWTGWIAFLIFVPLAMTSNDFAVKKLRQTWKPLQRRVYVAAVFTLAHWIFLEYELGAALVHFLPLAALERYRVFRNAQPSKALADA